MSRVILQLSSSSSFDKFIEALSGLITERASSDQ